MPPTAPHILFITTDHFRRDALGCAGHSFVRTPNLDGLAASGVRCERAYTVSPLCMPARTSWVTGRYPHQHGIFGNQRPLLRSDQRRATFANRLRAAGYCTALVGKHHLLDRYYQPGSDYCEWAQELREYGFDHVHQVLDTTESVFNGDDFVRHMRAAGSFDVFCEAYTGPGHALDLSLGDTSDGHIALRSIERIRRHDPSRPLFLWTSFVGPHPPYKASREFWDIYADADIERPNHRAYYAMVSHIDHWVGELLAAIAEQGMAESTLVVFTSDHGDMLGDHGIWDKRWFYEESVGVPLIASGPGLPTGTVSDALIESVDIPAGFLHAAGAEPGPVVEEVRESGETRLEERPQVPLPGRPFQRLIEGDEALARPDVFSELGTMAMLRDGRWKLWFDPEQGGVWALFDLLNDPAEQENLAGRAEHAATEARMVRRLLSRYIESSAATEVKERKRVQEATC